MTTNDRIVVFSARLPESQRRRVKSLAASLGLSLQEVVQQALDAWVQEHDPKGGYQRLPESQKRQIKSLAAMLGLSLQELVQQTVEASLARNDPQGRRQPSRGVLHGAEVEGPS